MPVPLSANANILARAAVKTAPRLAAMLMASQHSGVPLTATAHRAGASPAASTVLTPSNPLAKWGAFAVGAVEAARATRAVALQQRRSAERPGAHQIRSAVSPIADLYKRLLGEGTSISRPRSLIEQVEAAQPAGAGRIAPVLEKMDKVQPNRTSELVALAALVVGVGFGDQVDRTKSGDFDVTVFRNLLAAADMIAPGQAFGALDPIRKRAILTAGLQGSTGAFLSQLKDSGHVAGVLASASKLTPNGGKVAAEFCEGGKFNEALFLKKIAGVLAPVAQIAGATPVGAKAMLLIAAAEKAQELLGEAERSRGASAGLQARVRRSISDHLDEIDSLQPTADQPHAPGAR